MAEIPENAPNNALLALKPHLPDLTPDSLAEALFGEQDRLTVDKQAAEALGVGGVRLDACATEAHAGTENPGVLAWHPQSTGGSASKPSADVRPLMIAYYESLWKRLDRIEATLDQVAAYEKPILTLAEAAAYIGVGMSRFRSIVYEHKQKYKKLPDFVCNARGVMSYRVDRAKLMEWVCQTKRKPGRQPKRSEPVSRQDA
jgi:hypothetical protein